MSEAMTGPRRNVNGRARAAAQQALAGVRIESTDLVEFSSRGRVLVIGGPVARTFASELPPPLKAQTLLTSGEVLPGETVVRQGGRSLTVSGHLGAFTLHLGEPGQPDAETLHADLVLDGGDAATRYADETARLPDCRRG